MSARRRLKDREEMEARLLELREEAARRGTVTGRGTSVEGGPIPPRVRPGEALERPGYYGRPVLKPPVWTWEIPVYFFVGGIAGMSAVLAFAGLAAGARPELVRSALWVSVAGALASAALLVSDLGRPSRFLYMLRVFKWRSPMSVGVWLLTLFGGAVTLGAVGAEWAARGGGGLAGAATWIGAGGGAALGSLVGTYTGVLIGATVVPAWNAHRVLLPVHFGLAGLGSAAALLELLGFHLEALHLVGFVVAASETVVGATVELRRHGARDRSLREGRSGWTLRISGVLAGPVSLALRLLGWRSVAAVAFLLGALGSRFGWLWAGSASANDPEAALEEAVR